LAAPAECVCATKIALHATPVKSATRFFIGEDLF
jgi:hypothetical protein